MEKDIQLVLVYVREFLTKKKLILFCVILFVIFAVISILFSPKQYVSNTSFIPQLSNNSSGGGAGLKNIADLIGVNIGGTKEQKDIPLYLYPKLMSSLDYNRTLLNSRVTISQRPSGITLNEYYKEYKQNNISESIKKYTIGLPSLIRKKNRTTKEGDTKTKVDSLEYIIGDEVKIIKKLSEDVSYVVDDSDGSISISARMDEPILAAQVAERARQILQDKIIEYRLGRAQERYNYIDKQYRKKKEEYTNAQSNLAYYIDRNRFNTTQASLLRRKELENKASLAYAIYSEMESQRLREQININEDTPVFTTIQSAIVPIKEIGPSPIFLLVKYLVYGIFTAALLYLFTVFKLKFMQLWRTKEIKN